MKFNPLIVIPSPREIPAVIETINILPYDRLWIKHYPATAAYEIVEEEFRKHKEYTHMIQIPDDLIVPLDKLQILIEDTLNMPTKYRNKSVVTGYCSINATGMLPISNVSLFLPKIKERAIGAPRPYETYQFINMEGIRSLEKKYFTDFNPHLFQCKFNGFAAWIIPRKVKEKYTIRNDSPTGKDPEGCCRDVMASYDLHDLGIPIFTDQRVELKHLRSTDEAVRTFDINDISKRKIILQKAGEQRMIVIDDDDARPAATAAVIIKNDDAKKEEYARVRQKE